MVSGVPLHRYVRLRTWAQTWFHKVSNQPQGLYTRRQGWNRKILFNLRQVTSKCWTLWPCIGPEAEKRIPSHLGSQFATLGVNVPAFNNNADLGSPFFLLGCNNLALCGTLLISGPTHNIENDLRYVFLSWYFWRSDGLFSLSLPTPCP